MSRPVLRFAPSPNGELHLGHALSALLNFDLARRMGGAFLLRIEDIDTTRCTPELEAGVYRDLNWLGITWDGPVRRQSEHFDDYRAALDRLKAEGLAYPALMTRGEIRAHVEAQESGGARWPRDPDGAPLYPALDKRLADREREQRMTSGKPYAWRLDMEAAIARANRQGCLTWREFDPVDTTVRTETARPELWGDVILARSDIPTSYHLSVVVDDALQGVTHVVRGMDLFEATAVHRVLQHVLGLPQPVYHHHRLILDDEGRKLSKSNESSGLRVLREADITPKQVREMVGLAVQDVR